jgi:hypothetical protein
MLCPWHSFLLHWKGREKQRESWWYLLLQSSLEV